MNEFVRRPSQRRDHGVYVPPAQVVKKSLIKRSWTISSPSSGDQTSTEFRSYASRPGPHARRTPRDPPPTDENAPPWDDFHYHQEHLPRGADTRRRLSMSSVDGVHTFRHLKGPAPLPPSSYHAPSSAYSRYSDRSPSPDSSPSPVPTRRRLPEVPSRIPQYQQPPPSDRYPQRQPQVLQLSPSSNQGYQPPAPLYNQAYQPSALPRAPPPKPARPSTLPRRLRESPEGPISKRRSPQEENPTPNSIPDEDDHPRRFYSMPRPRPRSSSGAPQQRGRSEPAARRPSITNTTTTTTTSTATATTATLTTSYSTTTSSSSASTSPTGMPLRENPALGGYISSGPITSTPITHDPYLAPPHPSPHAPQHHQPQPHQPQHHQPQHHQPQHHQPQHHQPQPQLHPRGGPPASTTHHEPTPRPRSRGEEPRPVIPNGKVAAMEEDPSTENKGRRLPEVPGTVLVPAARTDSSSSGKGRGISTPTTATASSSSRTDSGVSGGGTSDTSDYDVEALSGTVFRKVATRTRPPPSITSGSATTGRPRKASTNPAAVRRTRSFQVAGTRTSPSTHSTEDELSSSPGKDSLQGHVARYVQELEKGIQFTVANMMRKKSHGGGGGPPPGGVAVGGGAAVPPPSPSKESSRSSSSGGRGHKRSDRPQVGSDTSDTGTSRNELDDGSSLNCQRHSDTNSDIGIDAEKIVPESDDYRLVFISSDSSKESELNSSIDSDNSGSPSRRVSSNSAVNDSSDNAGFIDESDWEYFDSESTKGKPGQPHPPRTATRVDASVMTEGDYVSSEGDDDGDEEGADEDVKDASLHVSLQVPNPREDGVILPEDGHRVPLVYFGNTPDSSTSAKSTQHTPKNVSGSDGALSVPGHPKQHQHHSNHLLRHIASPLTTLDPDRLQQMLMQTEALQAEAQALQAALMGAFGEPASPRWLLGRNESSRTSNERSHGELSATDQVILETMRSLAEGPQDANALQEYHKRVLAEIQNYSSDSGGGGGGGGGGGRVSASGMARGARLDNNGIYSYLSQLRESANADVTPRSSAGLSPKAAAASPSDKTYTAPAKAKETHRQGTTATGSSGRSERRPSRDICIQTDPDPAIMGATWADEELTSETDDSTSTMTSTAAATALATAAAAAGEADGKPHRGLKTLEGPGKWGPRAPGAACGTGRLPHVQQEYRKERLGGTMEKGPKAVATAGPSGQCGAGWNSRRRSGSGREVIVGTHNDSGGGGREGGGGRGRGTGGGRGGGDGGRVGSGVRTKENGGDLTSATTTTAAATTAAAAAVSATAAAAAAAAITSTTSSSTTTTVLPHPPSFHLHLTLSREASVALTSDSETDDRRTITAAGSGSDLGGESASDFEYHRKENLDDRGKVCSVRGEGLATTTTTTTKKKKKKTGQDDERGSAALGEKEEEEEEHGGRREKREQRSPLPPYHHHHHHHLAPPQHPPPPPPSSGGQTPNSGGQTTRALSPSSPAPPLPAPRWSLSGSLQSLQESRRSQPLGRLGRREAGDLDARKRVISPKESVVARAALAGGGDATTSTSAASRKVTVMEGDPAGVVTTTPAAATAAATAAASGASSGSSEAEDTDEELHVTRSYDLVTSARVGSTTSSSNTNSPREEGGEGGDGVEDLQVETQLPSSDDLTSCDLLPGLGAESASSDADTDEEKHVSKKYVLNRGSSPDSEVQSPEEDNSEEEEEEENLLKDEVDGKNTPNTSKDDLASSSFPSKEGEENQRQPAGGERVVSTEVVEEKEEPKEKLTNETNVQELSDLNAAHLLEGEKAQHHHLQQQDKESQGSSLSNIDVGKTLLQDGAEEEEAKKEEGVIKTLDLQQQGTTDEDAAGITSLPSSTSPSSSPRSGAPVCDDNGDPSVLLDKKGEKCDDESKESDNGECGSSVDSGVVKSDDIDGAKGDIADNAHDVSGDDESKAVITGDTGKDSDDGKVMNQVESKGDDDQSQNPVGMTKGEGGNDVRDMVTTASTTGNDAVVTSGDKQTSLEDVADAGVGIVAVDATTIKKDQDNEGKEKELQEEGKAAVSTPEGETAADDRTKTRPSPDAGTEDSDSRVLTPEILDRQPPAEATAAAPCGSAGGGGGGGGDGGGSGGDAPPSVAAADVDDDDVPPGTPPPPPPLTPPPSPPPSPSTFSSTSRESELRQELPQVEGERCDPASATEVSVANLGVDRSDLTQTLTAAVPDIVPPPPTTAAPAAALDASCTAGGSTQVEQNVDSSDQPDPPTVALTPPPAPHVFAAHAPLSTTSASSPSALPPNRHVRDSNVESEEKKKVFSSSSSSSSSSITSSSSVDLAPLVLRSGIKSASERVSGGGGVGVGGGGGVVLDTGGLKGTDVKDTEKDSGESGHSSGEDSAVVEGEPDDTGNVVTINVRENNVLLDGRRRGTGPVSIPVTMGTLDEDHDRREGSDPHCVTRFAVRRVRSPEVPSSRRTPPVPSRRTKRSSSSDGVSSSSDIDRSDADASDSADTVIESGGGGKQLHGELRRFALQQRHLTFDTDDKSRDSDGPSSADSVLHGGDSESQCSDGSEEGNLVSIVSVGDDEDHTSTRLSSSTSSSHGRIYIRSDSTDSDVQIKPTCIVVTGSSGAESGEDCETIDGGTTGDNNKVTVRSNNRIIEGNDVTILEVTGDGRPGGHVMSVRVTSPDSSRSASPARHRSNVNELQSIILTTRERQQQFRRSPATEGKEASGLANYFTLTLGTDSPHAPRRLVKTPEVRRRKVDRPPDTAESPIPLSPVPLSTAAATQATATITATTTTTTTLTPDHSEGDLFAYEEKQEALMEKETSLATEFDSAEDDSERRDSLLYQEEALLEEGDLSFDGSQHQFSETDEYDFGDSYHEVSLEECEGRCDSLEDMESVNSESNYSESSGDESFEREEGLRGYCNRAIDFTLHTIIEESCEESDYERKTKEEDTQKADPSELEKYFTFEIGNGPAEARRIANEDSEYSDTFSETSSSIFSEGVESVDTKEEDIDPADLASSRLEKYFLTGLLGGLERQPSIRSVESDIHTDESGSVGSDSEGSPSPEQPRKKLLRPRGFRGLQTSRAAAAERGEGPLSDASHHSADGNDTEKSHVSGEDEASSGSETAFDKADGQFDTIKRRKKKKSSSDHSDKRSDSDKSELRSIEVLELENKEEIIDLKNAEVAKMAIESGEKSTKRVTIDCSSHQTEEKEALQGESTEKKYRDSGFIGSSDDLLKDRQEDAPQNKESKDRSSSESSADDKTQSKTVGQEDASSNDSTGSKNGENKSDSFDNDSNNNKSENDERSSTEGKVSRSSTGSSVDLPPFSPSKARNKLSRKDSFNNWSSDEETNLMMNKMRAFFKTMISGTRDACKGQRVKPPQLVAFETKLTNLMKTVPGINDEQVKEIVEYLSSEETWSDSYDSSDYTSSDLEGAYALLDQAEPEIKSELQEQISASCQQIIQKFDQSREPSDTDSANSLFEGRACSESSEEVFVYQRLMSSLARMKPDSDRGSIGSGSQGASPPLLAKVIHHIGNSLVALMHEVSGASENGDDIDSLSGGNPVTSSPKAPLFIHRKHRGADTISIDSSVEKSSLTSTSFESEDSPTDNEQSPESDPGTPKAGRRQGPLSIINEDFASLESQRTVFASHDSPRHPFRLDTTRPPATSASQRSLEERVATNMQYFVTEGIDEDKFDGREHHGVPRARRSARRQETRKAKSHMSLEKIHHEDEKKPTTGERSESLGDLLDRVRSSEFSSSYEQLDSDSTLKASDSLDRHIGSSSSNIRLNDSSRGSLTTSSRGSLAASSRGSLNAGSRGSLQGSSGPEEEEDKKPKKLSFFRYARRSSMPDTSKERMSPEVRSTTLPRSNTTHTGSTGSLPRTQATTLPHRTPPSIITASAFSSPSITTTTSSERTSLFSKSVTSSSGPRSARYHAPGYRPPPASAITPKRTLSNPGFPPLRKDLRTWPSADESTGGSIEEMGGGGPERGPGGSLVGGIGGIGSSHTLGHVPTSKNASTLPLEGGGSVGMGSLGPKSARGSIASLASSETSQADEDVERLVLLHEKKRSGLTPLGSPSESMASVCSTGAEGRYGTVAVRGEIEVGLQYNYKEGQLEVLIVQCRDLAAVDTKRNRSDPYVKVYLLPDKSKSGKRKTKVKKHTLNPVFEEVLKFHSTMSELETRTLWVSVWHSDMFGRNDFLGEVILPFSDQVFDDNTPKCHQLQDRTEPLDDMTYNSPRGDLILALKFVPPDPVGSSRKNRRSRGALHVLIKEAKSLAPIKPNGSADPVCKGLLLPEKGKSSKQKTSVCRKTLNPAWNHTLMFQDVSLQDLTERCLEISVWDHDRLGGSQYLGGARLNLGKGKHNGRHVEWMDAAGMEMRLWEQMLDRPNLWVEGSIMLRPSMDKPIYSSSITE